MSADFSAALKTARMRKGYSQRKFAQSVNIPQSRLSRIENGSIDIRLSNFIELSRSLEMEPMLIPRQLVPTVKYLIRDMEQPEFVAEERPMYSLDSEGEDDF